MTGTAPLTFYTTRGIVFYTPTDLIADKTQPPRLPDPPCRPRQPRPHSIHITRLPAGFVPFDLRPPSPPKEPEKPSRIRVELGKLASRENAKRVLGSVLSSLSSNPSSSAASSSAASSTRSASPSGRPPSFIAASSDPASIFSRRAGLAIAGLEEPVMSRPSLDAPRRAAHRDSVGAASVNSATSAIPEHEKPVASKDGVSCYFLLAEPIIFLTGLDHDGTTRDSSSNSAGGMLRGRLQLRVTKSAKIKAVTVKFTGRARTEWAEGIPPTREDKFEEDSLRNQIIPFFNAMWEGAETGYGTHCNYVLHEKSANSSVLNLSSFNLSNSSLDRPSSPSQSGFSLPGMGNRSSRSSALLSAKETKRLSLQSNQSRSFQKDDPQQFGPTPQQKGYKTFHPGIYEYNFELPIDNNCPETTKLPLAFVEWKLEALVERAGTFKSNLQGFKEIPVVRSPSEDSLELVEPISITRKWEDQLHYDIIISGKSFPLGSKIPIAFKLTPLAKVQIHKIKVYVSENIEYFTNNKKVTRKDTTRKILLLEKSAGKPLAKEYAASDIRFKAGGEQTQEQRVETRQVAQKLRDLLGDRRPLPDQSDNLLGDIDLELEQLLVPTEMELDVQLPTCEMMKKNPALKLNHDCTWKNVNVHHWIKIVLRISRKDTESEDPKKRRHFEISIDSPFTILNCRATRENLALPEYSNANTGTVGHQNVCGCPNAASLGISPASSSGEVPTLGTLDGPVQTPEVFIPPSLARPPQAHLSTNASAGVQRPIHMLRNPSYNPPAFDAEDPPPPMQTPPPEYDFVIGTPSHDGLADYFARFSDAYDDDESTDDEDSRRASNRGRVNVLNPRTPGGRIARSMDIDRNFMFDASTFNRDLSRASETAEAT